MFKLGLLNDTDSSMHEDNCVLLSKAPADFERGKGIMSSCDCRRGCFTYIYIKISKGVIKKKKHTATATK